MSGSCLGGSNSALLPMQTNSGLAEPGEPLSPGEAQRRTLASFLRKVELLETWASGNVPEGQLWPKNQTELRRWHQPELSVFAWSSPNVASVSGPYADLRRRFDKAVGKLTSRRPEARLPELAQERMRRAAAERRVNALSIQITEVLAQNAKLESKLSVSRTRIDSMREEIERYKNHFGILPPKRAT